MKKLTSILCLISAFVFTFLFFQPEQKKNLPGFVPADDWFEKQRAFPFNEIPNDEYLKAVSYVKTKMQEGSSRVFKSTLQWQQAGPLNIEGRITAIAIHPADKFTAYIGTANGGIWKTTNFGQSFFPVFENQNTLSIGDIAVDPNNPEVIYCGTGEANSLRSYYPGTGVYKSTDGGTSWNFIGLGNSNSIGRIAVNPVNSNEIYIAAAGALRKKNDERGLFKSTDGGATWQNILYIADSVGVIDVVIDPSNPSKIFAASWERLRREDYIKYGGVKTALYVSTNSGASWSIVQGGFPSNQSTLGRISIDIAKSNPMIIYALTAYASGESRGLYKSTDGGNSWNLINSSTAYSSSYAWFNRICRVSPVDPNKLFCGGLSMELSADGGSNFYYVYDHHVDQHAAAFAPSDANYIIIGNDGGVEFSTDGGSNFTDSYKLPITQFYAGDINPSNPLQIAGGTQDNGTIRSTAGSIDNWEEIYGGDGFYVRVDYQNPQRWYACYQYGGLGRSTDGGNSFSYGANGLDLTYTNWMTPYVLDKNNPLIIYAGTYKVHKSTNGMESWNVISPDLANGHVVNLGTITTIDVSKSNPSVIYCGTDDANVWVTKNGGANWIQINNSLPQRWITRVTIHPDSANVCYVTLSGYKIDETGAHIFRTSDYGVSWVPINGNLPDAPINDVIIDPLDFNSLYIATDAGVFFTANLGNDWYLLGEDLPIVPCHDLTFDELTRTLVVWTHGRSAFKLILPQPPLPIELEEFTINQKGTDVILNWTTSTELNNLGFEILRSTDNINYYTAGFIKGKGTSSELNNYGFTDKNLKSSSYFYKLLQKDFDGSTKLLGVKEINFNRIESFLLAQNYPNPFNPATVITAHMPYAGLLKLKIFNSSGELIETLTDKQLGTGIHKFTFNAAGLASGVYFCKMEVITADEKYSSTKKMLLIK